MANLFCFGLGYSARHYIRDHAAGLERIAGTVTDVERAGHLAASGLAANGPGGRTVDAFAFDGMDIIPDLDPALAATDLLLVSVPPDDDGDPVLRHYGEAIASAKRLAASAKRLAAIVYLSTIGVYGDHGGAWVDETTEPTPANTRSRVRLEAEQAWAALAVRLQTPLAVLRLSGIYGPGRNVLRQLAGGTARRVAKPGQVFNRIHVADIAQAIAASFAERCNGIFNVTDDEPTPPGEPIVFAAGLLEVVPPPEVPFAEAAKSMSPMALSFYGESKRVRNEKMKHELGIRLRYPTYREGLSALFAAGEGAHRQLRGPAG